MISVSKNVYIDKIDDIINKYNNTCDSTNKMKPFDIKSSTYFDSSKEVNNIDPKLKLVIQLEYQNVKILLQKATFQKVLRKRIAKNKLKRVQS